MRTNMKKLAVLVAVFSVAMFMAVASASSGGQTIHGEYAVVGSGQCAMAPFGINPTTLLPNPDPGGNSLSLSPGPLTYYDGVYKFSPNGRGSASLTGKGFTSAPPDFLVGGWVQKWQFHFKYTVEDGAITFTTIQGSDTSTTIAGPGAGGPEFQLSTGPQGGNISPDGNILLIHCGAPVRISIENATLFELPEAAELLCNINLNGFKQWPRKGLR